jgi:ABC-type nitrate/sulfonate/bicarbonate transport system permease component
MFYLEKGYLQINIASTMFRFTSGFIIALTLAVPLGLLFGVYNKAYDWIAPATNFLRMTPPPAILPFAIIVFGIGEAPAVFVITVGCFFPIFLATIRGVRETETLHKEVVKTMGGSQLDVLRHAIFPSAIPSVATGVRIGFGIGWLVLIAGEIVAADSGLGFMIQGGRMRLDTSTVFVGMATISMLGLTMDFFLKRMEKFVTVRKKGGGEYIYY